MKPEYIKNFEHLGFGMFVHFGLYSMVEKGEWYWAINPECDKQYYFSPEFANKFNPKRDWAIKLVRTAKKAGAKYITLTTKHHEGYFLYDSKGLTDWDSMHYGPKRDLVREFVDACHQEGIVPFFYHAILDWHHPDYETNFPSFLEFLRKSVEVLCTNYGKIGGFWFDGFWNKPNEDWEFDKLYSLIRKYQPEAMIINNTGMSAYGEVGHYEIDSVTFERGQPREISSADGKERAGEMCEVFGTHWGYTKDDLSYKSVGQIIDTLITCRYCNCNLLLNTGPMGNGYVRPLDKCYLELVGRWIKVNKNFIYNVRKADIEVEGARVLTDGKYYYAVVNDVSMYADVNVQLYTEQSVLKAVGFKFKNARVLDSGEKARVSKDRRSINITPFSYGVDYCHRVIRFEISK